MPLPRITTRRWLLVVPGFAIACSWLAELIRLRADSAALIFASVEAEHKARLQILLGVTAGAVLVAAVALAHLRRLEFLRRAREHAEQERRFSDRTVKSWEGFVRDAGAAEYHARLRRKSERAARYPWLRVEPDPPEPN
jgi:hypothetical protein